MRSNLTSDKKIYKLKEDRLLFVIEILAELGAEIIRLREKKEQMNIQVEKEKGLLNEQTVL